MRASHTHPPLTACFVQSTPKSPAPISLRAPPPQTEAEGYDRELLGNMRRLQELQRHMAEKETVGLGGRGGVVNPTGFTLTEGYGSARALLEWGK